MNQILLPTELHRLPAHVKLGIRSRVGDQVTGSGEAAAAGTAAATYTACVGQFGEHVAQSNVPILAVQWVITGGEPVANYAVSPNAGVVTPVSAAMLNGNPLIFAWGKAGKCTVGVYITTAYGVGYVANNFNVTAPQVNFLEANTSQITVAPQVGGTFLTFGNPAQHINGIVINAVVFGAQSVAGSLGIMQLATNERFGTDTDGQSWHWSLNGQSVLDTGMTNTVIYQNVVEPLNPGANGQFSVTDSPAQQLGPPFDMVAIGDGEPIVPETYNSYLMFQPAGGIWVPLSVLTWYWAAYTQLQGGNWTAPQDPENSVNPVGVATSAFPVWGTNTANGQWIAGM